MALAVVAENKPLQFSRARTRVDIETSRVRSIQVRRCKQIFFRCICTTVKITKTKRGPAEPDPVLSSEEACVFPFDDLDDPEPHKNERAANTDLFDDLPNARRGGDFHANDLGLSATSVPAVSILGRRASPSTGGPPLGSYFKAPLHCTPYAGLKLYDDGRG